jgi:hypothetical protein
MDGPPPLEILKIKLNLDSAGVHHVIYRKYQQWMKDTYIGHLPLLFPLHPLAHLEINCTNQTWKENSDENRSAPQKCFMQNHNFRGSLCEHDRERQTFQNYTWMLSCYRNISGNQQTTGTSKCCSSTLVAFEKLSLTSLILQTHVKNKILKHSLTMMAF